MKFSLSNMLTAFNLEGRKQNLALDLSKTVFNSFSSFSSSILYDTATWNNNAQQQNKIKLPKQTIFTQNDQKAKWPYPLKSARPNARPQDTFTMEMALFDLSDYPSARWLLLTADSQADTNSHRLPEETPPP